MTTLTVSLPEAPTVYLQGQQLIGSRGICIHYFACTLSVQEPL